MKILNLFRSLTFLSTFFILIFLSTINQKEYIKLKIMVWNTPSLSLGTYLAISTSTGYILSYILTTSLAKANKLKLENKIKYKPSDFNEINNIYQEEKREVFYNNTLIERDIKDPSPTLKANFRVIGKTNRHPESIEYNNSDLSNRAEYQDYEKDNNHRSSNSTKLILNDWEDDSYSNW